MLSLFDLFYLWCVQEVAGLKDEDLSIVTSLSHIAGTGDPSSILSESHSAHMYNVIRKLFYVTVVLLYTSGIDDLSEVKKVLKTLNKWQSLGLELGLRYSTLERIKRSQHGDIEMCMLAAWLQQQDNVAKIGAPSWEVLQDGLKNIDENKLANEVDQ